MGLTTNFSLPYPAGSDSPAGHTQIQALADAVDAFGTSGNLIRSAKKTNISADQARTNTAYGELGTPDRASGIVLPTDGLVFVLFTAIWKSSVAGAGRAAIFLGTDQLKSRQAGLTAAPGAQEASGTTATTNYEPLASGALGLATQAYDGFSGDPSDVTTGQVVGVPAGGGACAIFAAAGTYDVSVRFKSSSGSVNVKNRKLWVWSQAFA